MSVRIYQLSKTLGMENMQLIKLLTDRNYPVKSASSTVDSITAESLIAEFGGSETSAPTTASSTAATPAPPESPPSVAPSTASGPKPANAVGSTPLAPAAGIAKEGAATAPERRPTGMVRTVADLEAEKTAKEEAARAAAEAALEAKRAEREAARAAAAPPPSQTAPGAAPALPTQPMRKAPPGLPPMGSMARKAPIPAPMRPAPGQALPPAIGSAQRPAAGTLRPAVVKPAPEDRAPPPSSAGESTSSATPAPTLPTRPAPATPGVRPSPVTLANTAPSTLPPTTTASADPATKTAPSARLSATGTASAEADSAPEARVAPSETVAKTAAPALPATPGAAPLLPVRPGGSAPSLPARPASDNQAFTRAPAIPPRRAPATAAPTARLSNEAATAAAADALATPVGRELPEGCRFEERDGQTILHLKPPIVVRDFAQALGLKPFQLNAELLDLNIFAGINSPIEVDVAAKLAARHGYLLEVHHRGEEKAPQGPKKPKEPEIDEDDPALLEPRPPVVCVLGHVDHGKTTLLDTIRKANVVSGEAGGITQHTAAYQVFHNNHRISFLDTPGHAAFAGMRERGARVTDIAILVVAADDGFMPQTDEALKFAQKSNVPLVVAVNKMDAKGANLDRVYQQMQQRGIPPEELGGEVLTQPISALKGTGIDDLLEKLLLQAEIMELKANPKANPIGTILESQIEQGRGCTTTVIVEKGTLKVGQALLCGQHYCKVRSLLDENGKPVKQALPGDPVRVVGWSGPPDAGQRFRGVANEKTAKREAEEFLLELKKAESDAKGDDHLPDTVEELLAAIDAQQHKVFRMILKSDVFGTVEALRSAFQSFESDKVKLQLVSSGVGMVTKSDVMMASNTDSTIVCFNVKSENDVPALAKREGIRIITHQIIYSLIDLVKEAMAELLDPIYREVKIGGAEVRAVFPVSKGIVAGCMVTDGIIKRDAYARLLRGDKVIHDGRIGGLRRFKDTVNEVRAGYECGIQITGCTAYQERDTIEVYEIHESRPTL